MLAAMVCDSARLPAKCKESRLNDLRCTVKAVRRTLASVTFENGEKWQWPIDELIAADGAQGFYLSVK